jgi:hypothetical protein
MTSLLLFRSLRRLEAGGLLALVLAAPAFACGPDFAETYYDMSGAELLAAPEGFFAAEIARITREIPSRRKAVITADQNFGAANRLADQEELPRALAERGVSSPRARAIAAEYQRCRDRLEAAKQAGEAWSTVAEISPQLPAGLPAEFAGYFRGAELWARGNVTAAQSEWRAVLERPLRERRYRSTWSAFMLGRAYLQQAEAIPAVPGALDKAVSHFRLVRAWVNEGLPDPLGLAVASLGWEARMEKQRGNVIAAIQLYLEQHAAGDPTALESLRRTAADFPQLGEEALSKLAHDPASRRVFTAYLVARGGSLFGDGLSSESAEKFAQTWATTLQAAGVSSVPEADRLAWLAYEGGLFALAQEWAALAPDASAETQWIRAKLALRGGDLRGGEKFLRAALAVPGLEEVHHDRLEAELGRVCLAQNDFAGTLTAWISGGHRQDAAFIAERVMTNAELICYVENNPTLVPRELTMQREGFGSFLRPLLARRLARAGQADVAARYFPDDTQKIFLGYVAAVKQGFDAHAAATERAAAFWRAAETVHEKGLELLGTELDPDWAYLDGEYQLTPSVDARQGTPRQVSDIFTPTPIEIARLQEQASPSKRFHYRYRAAELAWWAASLLPNESDETARILNEAGSWLKARDPIAANPFYQALVIRCGQTDLGRAAAERHWFP